MMARRALVAGDEVSAVEHRPGRQSHFADKLDPRAAAREGVLIPHRRYIVVGVARDSRARTARRSLLVALEDGGHVLKVRPGAVRLWTNPKERRRRYLAEAAAKLVSRGVAIP